MKKLRRKNGFTLIEMLIVVAIVAILIAVSIPLVSSSLERARKATDAANERAAKAEILICYMTDSECATGEKVVAVDDTRAGLPSKKYYAYDAANGTLAQKSVAGYGKYGTHKDRYLLVWIENNTVYLWWNIGGGFPGSLPSYYYDASDLCSSTLND